MACDVLPVAMFEGWHEAHRFISVDQMTSWIPETHKLADITYEQPIKFGLVVENMKVGRGRRSTVLKLSSFRNWFVRSSDSAKGGRGGHSKQFFQGIF